MKLVTDRTDCIIVKAKRFGDIHYVNYALISFDEKFINSVKAFTGISFLLKQGNIFKFNKLSYYADVICWFNNDKLKLPKGKVWSYIEITQKEIDKLKCPEDFIGISVVEFVEDGFRYVETDDESNEYFTEFVNPDEL